MDTEIGRIAALVDQGDADQTPLRAQIAWLGRQLGIAVVVLSAIVAQWATAVALASTLLGADEAWKLWLRGTRQPASTIR